MCSQENNETKIKAEKKTCLLTYFPSFFSNIKEMGSQLKNAATVKAYQRCFAERWKFLNLEEPKVLKAKYSNQYSIFAPSENFRYNKNLGLHESDDRAFKIAGNEDEFSTYQKEYLECIKQANDPSFSCNVYKYEDWMVEDSCDACYHRNFFNYSRTANASDSEKIFKVLKRLHKAQDSAYAMAQSLHTKKENKTSMNSSASSSSK